MIDFSLCVDSLIFLGVQEEVYRATTKGLIEGLISGYNATVFAYGPTGLRSHKHTVAHARANMSDRTCTKADSSAQTGNRHFLLNSPLAGCGKTYTMLGTDKEPGIYVRTLNDLFRAIEETSDDMLYSVSMSYLEVSRAPATPQREEGWKDSASSLSASPPRNILFIVSILNERSHKKSRRKVKNPPLRSGR